MAALSMWGDHCQQVALAFQARECPTTGKVHSARQNRSHCRVASGECRERVDIGGNTNEENQTREGTGSAAKKA